MNINRVAQLANDIKKPNKALMFESLVKLIESDDNESNLMLLANMYQYFTPPTPKTIKTPLDIAKHSMAKKDVRFYLKYIYVNENHIVATNGHVITCYDNNDNYKPGFYDKNMILVEDQSYARFPNYERAIVTTDLIPFDINSLELMHQSTGDVYHAPTLDTASKSQGYKKEYIDIIKAFIKHNDNGIFEASALNGSLKYTKDDLIYIVMPMRLYS
jgi:hypothetical protein